METTFVTVLQQFGFPVMCTCVLGWVIFKLATWGLNTVATPLVKAHVDFLNSVTESNKANTETLERICSTMPDICQAKCPVHIDCTNFNPKGSAIAH